MLLGIRIAGCKKPINISTAYYPKILKGFSSTYMYIKKENVSGTEKNTCTSWSDCFTGTVWWGCTLFAKPQSTMIMVSGSTAIYNSISVCKDVMKGW